MEVNVEYSKDNYKVLRINKNEKDIYIGSKYNQGKVIEKFINTFGELTNDDIYIIIGLSTGEHIEELINRTNKFDRLIIIEVDSRIRGLRKNDKYLDKVLDDRRISVFSNELDVEIFFREEINNINIGSLKLGYYANYDKIYKKELENIIKVIKEESYRAITDRNTNLHFGEVWFDAMLSNLKSMLKSTAMNDFKNKYKNKPAIIVSAGPSLSKNIKELKGKDNALILTGGRTIKALLENNIEPSFLGVVDAGKYSYELVEDFISDISVPLVYYNSTNSEIVKKHTGKKIFCVDNKFLNDILGKEIEYSGMGGSVAHFITNFAIYCGCNPIVFIGQDLAYTNDNAHDENALNKGVTNSKKAGGDDDIYVDDIYGNPIRTGIVLNEFRLMFEEIIKRNSEIEFINATEGGASIKGTRVKVLKQVLKSFKKEKIDFNYEDNFIQSVEVIKKLKSYKEILGNANKKCRRGLVLLEELKFDLMLNKNIDTKLLKLDEIDKYIQENLEKLEIIQNKIFSIMYSIKNSDKYVIKSTDSKKVIMEKNFNKNLDLYKLLSVSFDDASKKLDKLIIEMEQDNE